MFRFPNDDRPMTADERWMVGAFLFIFFGLFAADIVLNFEPVKISIFVFLAAWTPLIALHETGHALAAWLLGWRVRQWVVGVGRPIYTTRVIGTLVEVRMWPIEGFVRTAPMDLNMPRLKDAFIYFAGPGIELLFAGFILLYVGPERMFERTDDLFTIVLQSLAAASATQAILNLIPGAVETQNGLIPNDGLGILYSFLRPDSYFREILDDGDSDNRPAWEQDPDEWKKR